MAIGLLLFGRPGGLCPTNTKCSNVGYSVRKATDGLYAQSVAIRTGDERFVPRPIETAGAAQQIAEQIRRRDPQRPAAARSAAAVGGRPRRRVRRQPRHDPRDDEAAVGRRSSSSPRAARAAARSCGCPSPAGSPPTLGETIALWFSAGSVDAEGDQRRARVDRARVRALRGPCPHGRRPRRRSARGRGDGGARHRARADAGASTSTSTSRSPARRTTRCWSSR